MPNLVIKSRAASRHPWRVPLASQRHAFYSFLISSVVIRGSGKGGMSFKILVMGLPGAGKTTLATALAPRLRAVHLNADEIRKNINKDLGFSPADRIEQARRIGWLCDQIAKAGCPVIADFICPTPEARAAFLEGGPAFIIWVDRIKSGRFAGPFVHGQRGDRFLYLSWGVLERGGGEGRGTFTMFRRAKVHLDALDAAALEGAVVEGRLKMTADGGPVCASVRPPAIRWTRLPDEPLDR